jgi:hypothetical protein
MDTDRDQATPEKTGRGRRRQQEVGDEEKELNEKKDLKIVGIRAVVPMALILILPLSYHFGFEILIL